MSDRPSQSPSRSRAGVDVGGTFTDVVVTAGGRPRAVKVPTTPDDQGEAVVDGLAEGHPEGPVTLVAHGTTTATNALLERDVARTVLVVTEGFADVLAIARQDRPALYDLQATRPEPLVPRDLVVAVAERSGPDGKAVIDLTGDEVDRVVTAVTDLRPESVAISLLFSYVGPEHEQRLAAALADALDVPVTRSSTLLPEFREYERTSTCVLNAAVAPVMGRYLSGLADRLPDATITVMTSGGGTAGIAFAAQAPVHTLLSGPAAGVVAAGAVARSAGYDDAVAFDMGGTSTDVCLVRGGRPEVSTDAEIGGYPFRTPA
ncbi:MAG: hydantoinase/oxoprolinase family protein, partial [Actinomycetota bacterium]|nr:hydantoinase/oxoprolinase family protein [Actinomycetota bacterium]